MKKIILLLGIVLFFSSCEKVDDDSNLVCTGDCTSITGKAYTHSGIPLKNVLFKFRFQKSVGTFGVYTRFLSKEKTNVSGQYNMDFYIKDEELGEAVGGFDLYPQENTIPGTVFYPQYFHLFYNIFEIENRNVNFQKDLYLPTPKKVKVKLSNFNQVLAGDYFSFEVIVPCGFDLDAINPDTGNNHNYANTGINRYILNENTSVSTKEFEIELALNELNFLKVVRNKNGVYTTETVPLQVSPNSSQTYEFNY